MTWLIIRSEFGGDAVDGKLPGWQEKFDDPEGYRVAMFICAQGIRIRAPNETDEDINAPKRNWLRPEEAPDSAVVAKKYKKVRDAFFLDGAVFIVQKPIRDAIEALDPGLHQFLPIDVTHAGGKPGPDHPCFLLNVQVRADSLVEDERFMSVDALPGGRVRMTIRDHVLADGKIKPEVDAAAIPQAHLWRESRVIGTGTFMMSDELHAAIRNAGCKFFKSFQCVQREPMAS